MKKLIIATCLTCALVVAASAAEGEAKKEKKPSPAAEQKALRKELVDKYDTNKNSRLDKKERAQMTPEDLEKWNNLAAAAKKKSEAAKEKAAAKAPETATP